MGAVIMKMIRSTRTTSTKGVTLISESVPLPLPAWRRSHQRGERGAAERGASAAAVAPAAYLHLVTNERPIK